jgi:hypothetical protein
MHDPARADFKDDEDIQRAKRRRDSDEEIACEHGTGMMADEGAPLWNKL